MKISTNQYPTNLSSIKKGKTEAEENLPKDSVVIGSKYPPDVQARLEYIANSNDTGAYDPPEPAWKDLLTVVAVPAMLLGPPLLLKLGAETMGGFGAVIGLVAGGALICNIMKAMNF